MYFFTSFCTPTNCFTYNLQNFKSNLCSDEDEGEYQPGIKEIDSSYSDPLGPMPDRPKTSVGGRQGNLDDEFADEEIGDDLLPE